MAACHVRLLSAIKRVCVPGAPSGCGGGCSGIVEVASVIVGFSGEVFGEMGVGSVARTVTAGGAAA